ncbi:MAG TPA: energy transducer TonB [Thermoanaerobaculia bacterium]|jgi:protein TonB|nr:energy transducer TonB [Thermoanaerobaculia bacterium]
MFESSTPQQATARRSAWPLAISVLLHVGAITALVVAGARGPGPEAGERPIDILFLRAANGAAEAPAAAATSPAERQAARERQAMLDRLVQPTVIPGTEPAATAAAAPGTPRPAGAEAPAGETDLPVEAGGGVVSPVLIESSGVTPVYPEEALRAGLEGLVVLEAIVDERGRVGHDIKVVRRLGHGFDEAAVAAVRQWRFRPATRDGKPIKVRRIFPIVFRLQP